MKKLIIVLLLLSGCAAQKPVTFDHQPYEAGFTLPTGKQVPFAEIAWCHGIICQVGTDCAINEVYTSCEMRLLLTEEFVMILTEQLTLHTSGEPYYLLAPADGGDRLLGLLYREDKQWISVRFPGDRALPVSAQRLHVRGKTVLYLQFAYGNSISFSPDDKLFREESSIKQVSKDPLADL